MSLFTSFRTGVTGMNVQSRRVRSVSGDIANAKTAGYKGRTSEFSSLVNSGGGGGTPSGKNSNLSVTVKDRITPQKQGP
ncbi:MAG: hypothetical protein LBQ26_00580, partial [Holosporales bacterium]|nr:hypothetical protein [Holosporales bacterium]